MNLPTERPLDSLQALVDADDAQAFYAAWLGALVAACGGRPRQAVLVLGAPNAGPFLPQALWPAVDAAGPVAVEPELAQVCEQALEMRMPISVRRGLVLYAQPVQMEGDLHGVVAFAYEEALPAGLVAQLRWGQGWLERRLEQDQRVDADALRERLMLSLDLTMRALGEVKSGAACQAAVTEAAVRLGCDRVAVGFAEGGALRLEALSHSAELARRLDLTHAIEAAMNEALDQGMSIRAGTAEQGGDREVPAWLVRREHERLCREFGTGVVLSVPFAAGDDEHLLRGVLLFEWLDGAADESAIELAAGLAPILGRVLGDKRLADRPLRRRLADAAKLEWQRLIGPLQAKRKVAAAAMATLLLFFTFATGDYRVAANAVLEGGVRRMIVAPYDGFVATARMRAGQVVKAGEELATLDDRDVRLEASRWASQQTQYLKQTDDAQAQRNLAQIQIALAQARQAEAQRELSEAMVERAKVKAPFAGLIVSGDLSQQLGGAVKKGQTLFEIAPLDSYRVVLSVEEEDIAQVAVGQSGELMVTALPGETFPFRVTLVTPVASVTEGRNVFRVEATLLQPTERLRPGMEGVGKVTAGRRHLVWIWTHRMVDWLRLQLWAWVGV